MILKNNTQRQQYRELAEVHARIFRDIKPLLVAGTTGEDIDIRVGQLCETYGVKPAFKGVYGFPANLCVSVNACVVHGIPNDIPFQDGDIVKIDFGCKKHGLNTDAAFTMIIGTQKDPEMIRFIRSIQDALIAGISQVRAGNTVGDIGAAVEQSIQKSGYHIVRDLTGHGLGSSVHEKPYIYNYGVPGKGPKLQEGMVLAIEPIVGFGTGNITHGKNGVDIFMEDGGVGGQFENCLIVTRDGCESLVDVRDYPIG